MSSLLQRLRYMINDAFGKKTHAENQKKKYRDVIKRVEKQIKKTDNLEYMLGELKRDYVRMEVNPDSAQGKLSTTFVTKESVNRKASEKLGSNLKSGISDAKENLALAQEKYDYWCEEVEREDREMKIYQQEYYEEEERIRREEEERRREEERRQEEARQQEKANQQSRQMIQ